VYYTAEDLFKVPSKVTECNSETETNITVPLNSDSISLIVSGLAWLLFCRQIFMGVAVIVVNADE